MVESPQANSTASLESLERDVVAALSDAVKGGSQFLGGNNDVYSNVLPTAVAAVVGLGKGSSFFAADLMSDRGGKKSTGNKNTTTVKKDVMPKGGTSYFGRREQAAKVQKVAPTPLKGGKPNFRNQAFVDKVAAGLGLQKMSMGPGSFKIKGVKAEPKMIKNVAELKKIRDLIEQMKKRPFSNPNGTVNQTRLVKAVGVGRRDAERKLSNNSMNNTLLNNNDIWDKMGGSPPKFAS